MPAADQNQASACCDDADRGTGNTPQFDRIRELRKPGSPRQNSKSHKRTRKKSSRASVLDQDHSLNRYFDQCSPADQSNISQMIEECVNGSMGGWGR